MTYGSHLIIRQHVCFTISNKSSTVIKVIVFTKFFYKETAQGKRKKINKKDNDKINTNLRNKVHKTIIEKKGKKKRSDTEIKDK